MLLDQTVIIHSPRCWHIIKISIFSNIKSISAWGLLGGNIKFDNFYYFFYFMSVASSSFLLFFFPVFFFFSLEFIFTVFISIFFFFRSSSFSLIVWYDSFLWWDFIIAYEQHIIDQIRRPLSSWKLIYVFRTKIRPGILNERHHEILLCLKTFSQSIEAPTLLGCIVYNDMRSRYERSSRATLFMAVHLAMDIVNRCIDRRGYTNGDLSFVTCSRNRYGVRP